MKKNFLLFLIILFTNSVFVCAQSDYSHELVKNAENGDIESMFNLGNCYVSALGVKQDIPQGLYWLNKASEGGNAYAMKMLAYFYESGYGIKKDKSKSKKLYKESLHLLENLASQNDMHAIFELGRSYFLGEGLKTDEALGQKYLSQTIDWLENLANENNTEAMQNLGLCYSLGMGVEENEEKSAYWIKRAAYKGILDSANLLVIYLRNGYGMPKNDKEADNLEYAVIAIEKGNFIYSREIIKEIFPNDNLDKIPIK